MQGIHVFLNGARGLSVLAGLVKGGHGVASVVVPENKGNDAEIVGLCQKLGIRLMPTADVNAPSFVHSLAAQQPELLVICGFSTIFRRPLIDAARHGGINLHAGRLPQYRGGSPLNWQLINGESEAGISVVQVDEGIDTGQVFAEARIPIGPEDTISDIHARANALFPDLVLKTIEGIERGDLRGRFQSEIEAMYWHQRSDADGRIHWASMSAEHVHRVVRALTRPYPGAHTKLGDREVRVYGARIPDMKICGMPGRICWIQRQGPFVVAADRALLITDYTVGGKAAERLPNGAYLV